MLWKNGGLGKQKEEVRLYYAISVEMKRKINNTLKLFRNMHVIILVIKRYKGDPMKKKAVILIMIVLIALYFIGTGFSVRDDAVLISYSVSEDGTEITLQTSVASSTGYIRGYKNEGSGVKPHYLKFYNTFGGINSAIGAKNEFVLEVAPEDSEIFFYRGDGGYELVLEKDVGTGEWHKVR